MHVSDGPHLMHDPEQAPDEDGILWGQFANVKTSLYGARIVSDGQHVWALDDLVERGFVFVPLIPIDGALFETMQKLLDYASGYWQLEDDDATVQHAKAVLAHMREVLGLPEDEDGPFHT